MQDPELLTISRINPLRPNKEVSPRAQNLRVNDQINLDSEAYGQKIDPGVNVVLGRFPFVRTDRPRHSRCNEKFIFNQIYSATSFKS